MELLLPESWKLVDDWEEGDERKERERRRERAESVDFAACFPGSKWNHYFSF